MPNSRGGQSERPVIVVLIGDSARPEGTESAVREVLAGIEEEGVPYQVHPVPEAHRAANAADLAIRAAAQSPLQVGVGVAGTGEVCVCHARLEQPIHELAAGASAATTRSLGHNAARIVAGLPLKSLTVRDIGGV